MNTHPTIAALKAALESERLDEQKQWANATFPPLNIETAKDFTQDVNFARREVHALAYKSGHEAATARLLPLIEMYEDTLTAIDWHIRQMQNEKIISMKEMIRALKVISDNYKAREFLTTLADASGEGKNEP
jgi:hypothetical protein